MLEIYITLKEGCSASYVEQGRIYRVVDLDNERFIIADDDGDNKTIERSDSNWEIVSGDRLNEEQSKQMRFDELMKQAEELVSQAQRETGREAVLIHTQSDLNVWHESRC